MRRKQLAPQHKNITNNQPQDSSATELVDDHYQQHQQCINSRTGDGCPYDLWSAHERPPVNYEFCSEVDLPNEPLDTSVGVIAQLLFTTNTAITPPPWSAPDRLRLQLYYAKNKKDRKDFLLISFHPSGDEVSGSKHEVCHPHLATLLLQPAGVCTSYLVEGRSQQQCLYLHSLARLCRFSREAAVFFHHK